MVGIIKKNIIKIRAILSSLLIVIFLLVAITGIGLFMAPTGKVAYATNWTFLGMNKWQLEKIHTLFGFILVFLVILHFSLNYSMYSNEMKMLFRSSKKSKNNKK